MFVWMAVTKDKYELPIAAADTAKEFAEMIGRTPGTIRNAVSRSGKSIYKRVKIDEDETDGGTAG